MTGSRKRIQPGHNNPKTMSSGPKSIPVTTEYTPDPFAAKPNSTCVTSGPTMNIDPNNKAVRFSRARAIRKRDRNGGNRNRVDAKEKPGKKSDAIDASPACSTV